MPYYKDTNNQLHFLDDAAHESLLPAGCVAITDAQAAILLSPPPPTQAQMFQMGEAAVQSALDAGAQAWGYDDIKTAVGYIGDPFPRFNAEAVALRNWRSATWIWASSQQAAIIAGNEPMPASTAAFIAGMPAQPIRPS